MITLQYFVTSCGHLIAPKSWTMLHNPAAMMIGECFMDLIVKCLYMALIADEVRIVDVGDTVIATAIVGFDVGAATAMAVGARVVGYY